MDRSLNIPVMATRRVACAARKTRRARLTHRFPWCSSEDAINLLTKGHGSSDDPPPHPAPPQTLPTILIKAERSPPDDHVHHHTPNL